jgi:TolB-like protein/DNA-binding winged helix-turn-helix (wHTH) protein/Tfp pilus assembly protein PilF
MASLPISVEVAQFGEFEADLRSRELRRNRSSVRLPDQSFEVLAMLLQHPGELVKREDIQKRLWPSDTFVDFDHGLNNAVNRLREALGDSAEAPRFIETLPRRGYRFIASVKQLKDDQTQAHAVEERVPARKLALLYWLAIPIAAGIAFAIVLTAFNFRGWRDALMGTTPYQPIRSIAVLPLVNLSSDTEQEYVVDGMTDELITNLAKVGSLRVISRTSAMRYRNAHKSAAEIGKELGVDALVEGTFLRSGDNVRITAQLIHASTDRHLWAEEYNRRLRDVLALQSDVARDIAQSIHIRLTPQEQARLSGARPMNPEVEDLYWKGSYFLDRFTTADYTRSKDYFDQALQKDPLSARAWAGLADSYHRLGVWGDYEAFPKAKGSAIKALDLDDSLAQPHMVLGIVAYFYEWDVPTAEGHFRRALELNPNYAWGHALYALMLAHTRRFDLAIREIERTREVDPFSIATNSMAWHVYFCARQYDKAAQVVRDVLEMDPSLAIAHWRLSVSWEQKGEYLKAVDEQRQAGLLTQQDPKIVERNAGLLRSAYSTGGPRGYWRQRLALQLADWNPSSRYDTASIAGTYMHLGDKENALQWLEKAYELRDPFLIFWLPVAPEFDSLRSEPHFQSLLRRVGLPQ